MPDQYGRFSMGDGLAIANTVNAFQDRAENRQERQEKKQLDEQTWQVFDAVSTGKPLPEGVHPAAAYGGQLKAISMDFEKRRSSKEGMLEEAAKAEQRTKKIKDLSTNYLALRRSGQDDKALQIGREIVNLSPNGVWADMDEKGGAKITNWDHSVQEIQNIPVDQLDQYIAGMLNMDNDELIKKTMSGDEFRRQENLKALNAAIEDQWINDKGDIVFRVENSWGSDGKPVPAFFVRSPNDPAPIPQKDLKGYKPISASKASQEQKKGGLDITGKQLANQGTQIDNAKKAIIPSSSMQIGEGGQQGTVQIGQGGQTEFKPTTGLPLQTPESEKPPSLSDQNAMKEQQTKDLKAVLMPFKPKGSTFADMFNPDGEITDEASNALDEALKIINKHDRKEPLTKEEQRKVKPAIAAWQMYEKIVRERSASSFEGGGGGWRQWAAQPEPARADEDRAETGSAATGSKQLGPKV